jgi:uncharacterized protein (DUF58 family)
MATTQRSLQRAGLPADGAAGPQPADSGLAAQPPRDAEKILQRVEWTIVRRLDGLLQGEYRSLFYGYGLDLAEVREYQPEDDVRYMDWNVTARMDTPHVRQYLEDREITAWLLLDLSGSVDFGTARMSKRDVVTDFAAAMARLLTRRGNKVGAVLYSGDVDGVLPAGGGRRQALALVHLLARQADLPHEGVTDLAAVLDRAAQTIRRRSLVFVVSDFIARPGWEPAFHRLAARHEVIAVWVRDPREFDLPDVGPMVLEDAETGEQIYVDTHDRKVRARFHDLAREREATLLQTFKRNGADVLTLGTDGDMLQDLMRFALRRRRAMAPAIRSGVAGIEAPNAPDAVGVRWDAMPLAGG